MGECFLKNMMDNLLTQLASSKDTELRLDITGGPVPKTLPSNAGGVGSIPEQRSHRAHGQKTKTQNRSNIITNLIKTLKMVHI